MTVTTDFSNYNGALSERLRQAAASHDKKAIEAAARAFMPGRARTAEVKGVHDEADFYHHAQAAATLRDVAELLDLP